MVSGADRVVAENDAGDRLLRRGLDRVGLRLDPARRAALEIYRSELLRWGTRVNLTGLRSGEAIVREGFLRSLAYRVAFDPAPGMQAIDIGSGAGFPGLVLKICFPEIEMLLLEAARMRATFLRFVIRRLGLVGVRCLRVRAEELHGDAAHQGRYHVAFARAVGPLPAVLSLAEPFLCVGGRLILQAGRKTEEALDAMSARLPGLGLTAAVHEAPGPDEDAPATRLVVVEKLPRPTP